MRMLSVCCIVAAAAFATLALPTLGSPSAIDKSEVKEWNLVTKSLDDLIGELAVMRKEALTRLDMAKANEFKSDAERIRQVKVSKFVLAKIAELEAESASMQRELSQVSLVNRQKIEDDDFGYERPEASQDRPTSTPTAATTTTATNSQPQPTTTQAAENAKIGFDVEALKKLASDFEHQIEARQASVQSSPETIRGVHAQTVRLVDNIVQNYLASMRSTLTRLNVLLERRRSYLINSVPRRMAAPADDQHSVEQLNNLDAGIKRLTAELDQLEASCRHFSEQMKRLEAEQGSKLDGRQSPLWDRIPPRGTELWRDFWDTVRKQARRINSELERLGNDLRRVVTGGSPSRPSSSATSTAWIAANMAAPGHPLTRTQDGEKLVQVPYGAILDVARNNLSGPGKYQNYYEKIRSTLLEERKRLAIGLGELLSVRSESAKPSSDADLNAGGNKLESSDDDESTRNELARNPMLRQQIQDEIGAFGGIFDIMREFMHRLREAAASLVRDVVSGPTGARTPNNDNNAVTPGPDIKPAIDQLVGQTLDSQRNINGQAKPVSVPNTRVTSLEEAQLQAELIRQQKQKQQQTKPREY